MIHFLYKNVIFWKKEKKILRIPGVLAYVAASSNIATHAILSFKIEVILGMLIPGNVNPRFESTRITTLPRGDKSGVHTQ